MPLRARISRARDVEITSAPSLKCLRVRKGTLWEKNLPAGCSCSPTKCEHMDPANGLVLRIASDSVAEKQFML